jgi:hypothetical protein
MNQPLERKNWQAITAMIDINELTWGFSYLYVQGLEALKDLNGAQLGS